LMRLLPVVAMKPVPTSRMVNLVAVNDTVSMVLSGGGSNHSQ
jgi:hypothetical protein